MSEPSSLNDVLANLGHDPVKTPAAPLRSTLSHYLPDDAGKQILDALKACVEALAHELTIYRCPFQVPCGACSCCRAEKALAKARAALGE